MSFRFLAVDDEVLALSDLTDVLGKAAPECEIHAFNSPLAALADVQENGFRPDVAFLDIRMRGWTGLQLATELKRCAPATEIVFVTAYSHYALESYSLHARGYLMKPVTQEAILEELQNLRPAPHVAERGKLMRVQCFGNFEAFCREKPVEFSRAKSKELFAYLIYRNGAACSVREIAAVLFEDRAYDRALKNQLEMFKSDLMKTLRACESESVIIKRRNSLSVDAAKLDCDYYRFLSGEIAAVNAFSGEFMAQYSWAEMTAATLADRLLQQIPPQSGMEP